MRLRNITHLTVAEYDAIMAGAPPDPFICVLLGKAGALLLLPDERRAAPQMLGKGMAAIFALAVRFGFRYVRIDPDCAYSTSLPLLVDHVTA